MHYIFAFLCFQQSTLLCMFLCEHSRQVRDILTTKTPLNEDTQI